MTRRERLRALLAIPEEQPLPHEGGDGDLACCRHCKRAKSLWGMDRDCPVRRERANRIL